MQAAGGHERRGTGRGEGQPARATAARRSQTAPAAAPAAPSPSQTPGPAHLPPRAGAGVRVNGDGAPAAGRPRRLGRDSRGLGGAAASDAAGARRRAGGPRGPAGRSGACVVVACRAARSARPEPCPTLPRPPGVGRGLGGPAKGLRGASRRLAGPRPRRVAGVQPGVPRGCGGAQGLRVSLLHRLQVGRGLKKGAYGPMALWRANGVPLHSPASQRPPASASMPRSTVAVRGPQVWE
jgi:hypothetical protein